MTAGIPMPVGPVAESVRELDRYLPDDTGQFLLFYDHRSRVGCTLDLKMRVQIWNMIGPVRFEDYLSSVHAQGAVLSGGPAYDAWCAACLPGWVSGKRAN